MPAFLLACAMGFAVTGGPGCVTYRGARCHIRAAEPMPSAPSAFEVTLPKPLGLVLEESEGTAVIVAEVLDTGSAAEDAQIQPGIELLAVNGEACTSFECAMDLITGGADSVVLTFQAPDDGAHGADGEVGGDQPRLQLDLSAQDDDVDESPVAAPPVTITVEQQGKGDVRIDAPKGAILRSVLIDNQVDVYTLVGKMTNCGGVGQCGTCIVDVVSGECSPRRPVEDRKLKGKPASLRLACQTTAEGDVRLRTKP